MTSTKNLPAIFGKVIEGTAPNKFTHAHLKSLGFKSSNDVGILGIMKDLGFLTDDGSPTARYHEYRDKSKSKAVMADGLREAYEDLFHINEKPTEADRAAIEGKFKSVHNVSDRVAAEQAKTFFAILKLADLGAAQSPKLGKKKADMDEEPSSKPQDDPKPRERHQGTLQAFGGLRYNVEIHLPATKDVEVYNAIFKSLKEHLLED